MRDKRTTENTLLLRSLDSQAALSEIATQQAITSREDAARWHRECLEKDVTISQQKITIEGLQNALEAALANQAPMLTDELADKALGKVFELCKTWATTPTDKGYAAMVLKRVVALMLSIQSDDEIKRALLLRHKKAFVGLIESFNEVAESAKLPGRLVLPLLPKKKRGSTHAS